MEKLIKDYQVQLAEPGCKPGSGRFGALATTPNDISPVFPYLNAVWPNARYDHDNKVLIWEERGQVYAFRPREIRLANVENFEQASQVVADIVERINDIWQGRGDIVPRYAERKMPSVLDIYKLLPKTNCRQCGYATCMAFAADLRKCAVRPEQCPPLMQAENAGNREKIMGLVAGE
ncbi:MAG: hypothetical protein HYX79_10690 [Chloroflexi bacterium]|nr:hypothetical protein [Chloroflexota bacterium]